MHVAHSAAAGDYVHLHTCVCLDARRRDSTQNKHRVQVCRASATHLIRLLLSSVIARSVDDCLVHRHMRMRSRC